MLSQVHFSWSLLPGGHQSWLVLSETCPLGQVKPVPTFHSTKRYFRGLRRSIAELWHSASTISLATFHYLLARFSRACQAISVQASQHIDHSSWLISCRRSSEPSSIRAFRGRSNPKRQH